MKTVTPFLVKFAIVATFLTLFFRYFLSYGITNESAVIITISASVYGALMFISGWYFGKKEGQYLPIYDTGFRFHLTTYLVFNLISVGWFLLGLNSKYEKISVVYTTAVIWGVILLVHFILFLKGRKNAINHLDKYDLFE